MKRLALIIGCLLATSAAQATYSGYTYRRTLTIAHAQVPNTDQSNFPVLISTTDATLATSGHANNGYDIVFSTMSDASFLLKWDTETYNSSTGNLIAWVKVPTVATGSDTTLYMFYGNSGVTTYQGVSASAWDGNFKGVWHFPNGTNLTANDSAGVNNGTLQNSPNAIAGKVDGGVEIQRAPPDRYITVGTDNSLDMTSNLLSIETWLKRQNTSMSLPSNIFTRSSYNNGYNGYLLQFDGNATDLIFCKGGVICVDVGNVPNDTNWHHVVLVQSNSGIVVYVDGLATTPSNSDTGNVITSVGTLASIGPADQSTTNNDYYLDEVRVSNTARSADWIATEYNNQSSPSTFLTIGAETTSGAAVTPNAFFFGEF